MKGFFFDYSISNSFFVIKRRLWFGVIFYKCFDAFEHFCMGGLGLLEYVTEKNIRSSNGDRLVQDHAIIFRGYSGYVRDGCL